MKRWRLFLAFSGCAISGQTCLAALPAKVVYRIMGMAVSTRNGAPIPYCRLQLTEVDAAAPEQQRGFRAGGDPGGPQRRQPEALEVEADVHGRFQTTVDKPGLWLLSGSARDFRRQVYDAHDGFYAAIVLTPASPVAEVTFRMQQDALVQGLVLDEAGEPVRNAQVAAEALTEEGRTNARGSGGGRFAPRQAGTSQTDDRGRYELSGLAPGSYRIRVQAQPWYAQIVNRTAVPRPTTAASLDPSLDVVYPTTWFPGAGDDAGAEVLRLSGGEERQADFHLNPVPAAHLTVPRQASISPTDDGRPRPQRAAVLVRISPAGGGLNLTITGDANTQQFGGLTPGLYEIHTFGADGSPDSDVKQIRIPAGGSGTINLSTAQLLTKVTLAAPDGDAEQAGRVTFTELSTGRVVSQNGFDRFRRRNDPAAPASSPENSVALAPGRWEVRMPTGSDAYLTGLSGAGLDIQGSTITVGEQPATLTLTLHFGSGRGEIAGVALAGGKPVEAAMVLLVPATLGDPGSLAQTSRAETNTDGSFRLRGVVPGKYILLAIAHGWDVRWQQTEVLLAYLTHGTPVEVSSKARLQREIVAIEP